MTITVKLPDGNTANFPDGMTADQITAAIQGHLGTAPKAPAGLATGRNAVTPQTVDPGFLERLNQRGAQSLGQETAPPLSPNAGLGSQAADTIGNVEDYINGLAGAAGRGMTFGTYDEAGALGKTLAQSTQPTNISDVVMRAASGQSAPSFGDRFITNDKAENAAIDQFKAQNPIVGNTAEIAGMLASPVGTAGTGFIQRGGNVAARALRAAGVGGAVGAGAGAVQSDGGLADRAQAALYGGAIGTAGAGILNPSLEALTGVARTAGNTIANQWRALRNPQNQAQRLLANALIRDQQSAPQAIAALQASPDLGIVNAGGQNVSALGRAATVAPGNARTRAAEFFENQAASMPDRAADAVHPLAQNGYYGTVEQLDQTRRTAADPLYTAAYAQPAVDKWSPEINNLMNRPSMRRAAAQANTIAAEEGRDPAELGLTFNAAGDPVFVEGARNGRIPSVQTMDYMKRGLDDVLEQYRDKTTGRLVLDTAGRAMQNTRAQFVQLLRDPTHGNANYAAALDAWGGPSHALDMAQYGRDLWKSAGNPADRLRQFAQMSANDQEMVRTGLMREALNKIGNLGDNSSVYNALYGNSNKRAIFEAAFPTRQAFDQFATAMRRERDILGTQRTVMGGSPTARIGAENADAMQQLGGHLGILKQLLTGHPIQALGTAVTRAGNVQRGMSEPVANELGNILFNPSAPQNVALLQQLQGTPAIPGILQQLIRQQGRTQALGGAARGLLTNATAQPAGLLGAMIARQ